MRKKIGTALISVFYKDGLDRIVTRLHELGVSIYSTGGTRSFIEGLGIPVTAVESLTGYPSILGGRVKTLHPLVFGGILGKRDDAGHRADMQTHGIPEIDLVIVDLYPFEETLASGASDAEVIEKIDIGGPSMIRAAAKNHRDVVVVCSRADYPALESLLDTQAGETTLEQRRAFAARAFDVCAGYDIAIANYFGGYPLPNPYAGAATPLRYGENPQQRAWFRGNLPGLFRQLHGKALSYNNLVDLEAAVQLVQEFRETSFAIIKHTNPCGVASRSGLREAWEAALAGDPESAFGGVLACNAPLDADTASAISEIFFEVLVAPSFTEEALEILRAKKNRILLQQLGPLELPMQHRTLLGGLLSQEPDREQASQWEEAGGRATTETEKQDLVFANLVCKHLKSNAIALVRNRQLIGKGCGQTSRIDALRQAIEKARQFAADLNGAVLASDAFFPFDDCVRLAHEAGIAAFIQPGGSIRDKDSIDYCRQHGLAMVLTGTRHFKH